MKERRLIVKILPYLLVLPSMLLLAVVVLFPIISNIGRSFQLEEGGVGLDNYIYFLRRRLAAVNSCVKIVTVRGVGYRLEVST